ncbi:hypothetical protein [Periweissella fabalis]|uniref:Uncharacterized protein n=1 Tax=Periweissella fabalis TaxID=1070421 RepID=A0A7X6S368_9LACO|nr:hypothetical protein [Periweissella fabalis]MCM0598121.1 hypothetical protein [Periweissella fabalis]NKZ24755.1 hypothetical protein [Periweissella fabalis]
MSIKSNILTNKKYHLIIFGICITIFIAIIFIKPIATSLVKIGDNWQTNASHQTVSKVIPIQKIKFSRDPRTLQEQLHTYLVQNHLDAVAITTVNGSKTPMIVANGNISNFSNDKLNEHSVFQVGSIQKNFHGDNYSKVN